MLSVTVSSVSLSVRRKRPRFASAASRVTFTVCRVAEGAPQPPVSVNAKTRFKPKVKVPGLVSSTLTLRSSPSVATSPSALDMRTRWTRVSTMVPWASLSAMTAFTGMERSTKKVSSSSVTKSRCTSTLMVAASSPGAKVKMPEVWQ